MAQPREAQLLINNFSKGINQAVEKSLIQPYEACAAKNFDIADGALRKRKDDAVFKSQTDGVDITPVAGVRRLIRYSPAGWVYSNILDLYATVWTGAASYLKRYNTTTHTWNTIFTLNPTEDGAKVDYINYSINDMDVMIFCNGIDSTQVWDGTNYRNLKQQGSGSTEGPTNRAPICRHIELFKERIFMAGDPNDANMVYFSRDIDPDDWLVPLTEEDANQHGGFFLVPTWDSGKIIGLKALYDDLIIFKNTAVFKLSGSSPADFYLTKIFDSSEGYIIDETIKSVDNMAFWSTTNGIYAFDGTNVACISDRIKETYKTVAPDKVKNAVAEIYDNKYVLAITTGASSANNIVLEYDIKAKCFMQYDSNAPVCSFLKIPADESTAESLLFATPSTGNIYKYKGGITYNSLAQWESGNTSLNSLNTMKNSSKVYIMGSGSGTFTITLKSEKVTKTKTVTINSAEIKPFNVKIKGKGRAISLKIECPAGSHVEFSKVQIIFELDYD